MARLSSACAAQCHGVRRGIPNRTNVTSLCDICMQCMCVSSRTVTLKGRVACEMNTCDELLATEILFFNVLEPLNPPEVASFLSALVFQVSCVHSVQ